MTKAKVVPPIGYFLRYDNVPFRRQSHRHWPEKLQGGKWVVYTDLFKFDHEADRCSEEEFRAAVVALGGDPDADLDPDADFSPDGGGGKTMTKQEWQSYNSAFRHAKTLYEAAWDKATNG